MTDILEQLKNRSIRPVVPDRSDPLIENSSSSSNEAESQVVTPQKTEPVTLLPEETDYGSHLQRFTLRIDLAIATEIEEICRRQKITPETLFEAFFSVYGQEKGLMKPVFEEARHRYEKRKTIGVRRRLKTMNERFNT